MTRHLFSGEWVWAILILWRKAFSKILFFKISRIPRLCYLSKEHATHFVHAKLSRYFDAWSHLFSKYLMYINKCLIKAESQFPTPTLLRCGPINVSNIDSKRYTSNIFTNQLVVTIMITLSICHKLRETLSAWIIRSIIKQWMSVGGCMSHYIWYQTIRIIIILNATY